jgi:dTDP-4-amino-4,6-dideoxygalactose transaminase
MTNLQAALGLAQLEQLEDLIKKKKKTMLYINTRSGNTWLYNT